VVVGSRHDAPLVKKLRNAAAIPAHSLKSLGSLQKIQACISQCQNRVENSSQQRHTLSASTCDRQGVKNCLSVRIINERRFDSVASSIAVPVPSRSWSSRAETLTEPWMPLRSWTSRGCRGARRRLTLWLPVPDPAGSCGDALRCCGVPLRWVSRRAGCLLSTRDSVPQQLPRFRFLVLDPRRTTFVSLCLPQHPEPGGRLLSKTSGEHNWL